MKRWLRPTAFVLFAALFGAACTSSDRRDGPDASSPAKNAKEAKEDFDESSNPSLGKLVNRTFTDRDGKQTTVALHEVTPRIPDVPLPPEPLKEVPDLRSRGQQLADATAPGSQDAEAAWLAVYDLAAIPVMGADGIPVGSTGDDPFGPTYSHIWMVSRPNRGVGLSLADIVATTVAGAGEKAPEDQLRGAASAFVADLRALMERGGNDEILGDFIDAKIRQFGNDRSLFDPSFDASRALVDPGTAQLLGWIIARSLAIDVASRGVSEETVAQTGASLTPSRPDTQSPSLGEPADAPALGVRSFAAPFTQAASGWQCGSALPLGESLAAFTTWVSGQAKDLPGIVTGVVKWVKDNKEVVAGAATAAGGALATVLSVAGVLATIASYLMLINALSMDTNSTTPLRRAKVGVAAQNAEVTLTMRIEATSLPDGNDPAMCALSTIGNVIGVPLQFPPVGVLSGVEVRLDGGTGFVGANRVAKFETGAPDVRVLGAGESIIPKTGADGTVTFRVEEIPRPSGSLPPANAQKVVANTIGATLDSKLTVRVASQPESENVMTSVAIFVDLAKAISNPVTSGIAAAVGVLKTAHYSVGEVTIDVEDWRVVRPPLRVTGGVDVKLTGVLCDGKPATLTGRNALGQLYSLDLTPTRVGDIGTEATGVFYEHSDNLVIKGRGQYRIRFANGAGDLVILGGKRSVGGEEREYLDPEKTFRVEELPASACAN